MTHGKTLTEFPGEKSTNGIALAKGLPIELENWYLTKGGTYTRQSTENQHILSQQNSPAP